MSLLEITGLTAGYGNRRVLLGLDLRAEAGQIVGLLGANGCGKTTALKAICGILPSSGTRLLRGIPMHTLSPRQIARLCHYIPQRSGITIDLPVGEVVLMGFNPWLGLLNAPNAAMVRRAEEALALVGLAGREEENYQHLSEGEKQLCILARALAPQGQLFLLDEPESALDFGRRYRMLELLRRRTSQGDCAALAALHDPQLALNQCDTLVLLREGVQYALLRPAEDPLQKMEEALAGLYGPLSLHRIPTPTGSQLVMIRRSPESKEAIL